MKKLLPLNRFVVRQIKTENDYEWIVPHYFGTVDGKTGYYSVNECDEIFSNKTPWGVGDDLVNVSTDIINHAIQLNRNACRW